MNSSFYLLALWFFGFLFYTQYKTKNENSNTEEWISLFNGKDFNDWDIKIANRPLNDNYFNTFQVEDGMIRIVYDEYNDFDDKYGHMYYHFVAETLPKLILLKDIINDNEQIKILIWGKQYEYMVCIRILIEMLLKQF